MAETNTQELPSLVKLNEALKKDGWDETEEELTEEDREEISARAPKRPSFPVFIFSLAIFKDLGDLVSLGFLGLITNIFAAIAIRLWLMGKMGFIKRKLYKRMIIPFVLGFIPFANYIVPEWTVFVVRAHLQEYKKIDSILNAMESALQTLTAQRTPHRTEIKIQATKAMA